ELPDEARAQRLVVAAGPERVLPLAVGQPRQQRRRPPHVVHADGAADQFRLPAAVGKADEAVLDARDERLALEALDVVALGSESFRAFAERGAEIADDVPAKGAAALFDVVHRVV